SHPQVMVFVKEKKSKPIVVVGAVTRPMVVQADRPVTLIEVLAEAGGISQDASDQVIITRGALDQTVPDKEPPEIGADEPVAAGNRWEWSPKQSAPPAPAHSDEAVLKPAEAVAAAKPLRPVETKLPETTPAASTPPPITEPQPPASTISVNLPELLERGDT